MSKRRKLLERIRRNPKNVSFEDFRKLLEQYGFELRRSRGSHFSFIARIADQEVLLVIPYNQPMQAVYVKKALIFIDQIIVETVEDEEGEADENEDE
ncbi:MAG: type II toxin-antitoxin system HicA family toxin [Chloroflexi bacterium]|nr:type II toxin-antitoxin system HicA family toxin [Chloroflexota bacterium]MDL1882175.1 type II toxin-antitoxin system HicA family toxin [Anaerolineae bacterium CFX8]